MTFLFAMHIIQKESIILKMNKSQSTQGKVFDGSNTSQKTHSTINQVQVGDISIVKTGTKIDQIGMRTLHRRRA